MRPGEKTYMGIASWINKPIVAVILIVTAGLSAYSNTLHVPFQWDEDFYIRQNPFVTGTVSSPDELRTSQTSQAQMREQVQSHELYKTLRMRSVGYKTFSLNYRIHGLSVEGYHVVNIAIHLLNGILLWLLVRFLFMTPALRTSLISGQAGILALLIALFFVVHPMQTEAVTYIMQRLASLAVLFYLGAVVAYLHARLATNSARRSMAYAAAIALAFLAVKTKENAVTLPVAVTMIEVLFFRDTPRRRLVLCGSADHSIYAARG